MSDRPLFTLPRIKAPVLDGKLSSPEWGKAARMTGFVGINENTLVEDQTTVYAGWDDEALYLAFECIDPQKRQLVARTTERNGPAYADDAVDILLQPRQDQPFYHMTSNVAGVLYDARSVYGVPGQFETDFDPDWTVKTSQQPGRWVMECKIPFSELDDRPTPQDGERWRLNFCRDADNGSRLSSWAFADRSFHKLDRFGEVIFSTTDRSLRLSSLGEPELGKLQGTLGLTGAAFDPLVTVNIKVTDGEGETIVETENRLADYKAVNITAPTLVTGNYALSLRASTAAGDMYRQRLPFKVVKPYDINVAGYPYEGKLWVTANIAGLSRSEGVVARSQLLQNGNVLATSEVKEFTRGIGQSSFDIDDLAPGFYEVKSAAVAPDGTVLAEVTAEYEHFAKPAWWRSDAGIDRSVPPPWTPVEFNDGTYRVLNREYRTGNGSLPKQVVTVGREILSNPISLRLSAGGTTTDLAQLAPTEGESFPDAVTRGSSADVGPLGVTLKSTTEFDGMQLYDLTLTPQGSGELGGDIDELTLEIPIKSEFAKYILPSTGMASVTSVIGDEPWHSGFLPQVWVGDDDLGYGWFAETDEFWKPRDDQMIEVVREGEQTFIRCKIVRETMHLDKPVTLTFGLMATPNRDPVAGDAFRYRFGNVFNEKTPIEYLRYPGPGNIDPTAGTLEFWLSPSQAADGRECQVASIGKVGDGLVMTSTTDTTTRIELTVENGGNVENVSATGLQIGPGEFAHIAVTWGNKVELFVDGVSYGTTNSGLPAAMVSDPAHAMLYFGTTGGVGGGVTHGSGGDTDITLDEIRISKVNRYPTAFTPATAPFDVDEDTLLLDHLDVTFRPDGEDAETRADKVSGQSGELGGVPSIGSRFVAGKFGNALHLPPSSTKTPIEFVREQGADTALMWVWHEEASIEVAWPPRLHEEPRRPGVREIVKEFNDAGLRLSPYTAYPAIGAPSPVAAQFGHEWGISPLSTLPYEPPKGHYMWNMCNNSGFADYIAAGTGWVLHELGFYGIYTDGLTWVPPCQNSHHGCGYTDEEGVVHSTWPIFATRDLLKRMYRQIKAKNPDGYLTNHMSFNSLLPSITFSDMYYTGEHEPSEDLLKWRTRWQGSQLGYWPIILGGESHGWEPMYNTYSLLHGVSVLPNGLFGRNDHFRKTANLWQTYDRFGYREAEWIPYYRAETSMVQPAHDEVKASLYLHRGTKAMIIVGNLTHEVVETTIDFNWPELGLQGKSATNMLDGRSLPLDDKTMPVRLRPVSFLLVEVQ